LREPFPISLLQYGCETLTPDDYDAPFAEVFDPYFEDGIQTGGALAVIENSTGENSTGENSTGENSTGENSTGGHIGTFSYHAFQFTDAVIFVIGPNNFPSQKAFINIGGVPDQPRPDGSLIYRINKLSWSAR